MHGYSVGTFKVELEGQGLREPVTCDLRAMTSKATRHFPGGLRCTSRSRERPSAPLVGVEPPHLQPLTLQATIARHFWRLPVFSAFKFTVRANSELERVRSWGVRYGSPSAFALHAPSCTDKSSFQLSDPGR